jgi:hypothetical protein
VAPRPGSGRSRRRTGRATRRPRRGDDADQGDQRRNSIVEATDARAPRHAVRNFTKRLHHQSRERGPPSTLVGDRVLELPPVSLDRIQFAGGCPLAGVVLWPSQSRMRSRCDGDVFRQGRIAVGVAAHGVRIRAGPAQGHGSSSRFTCGLDQDTR